MNDWRIIAEWDWIEIEGDELLHAVHSVDDDDNVEEDWGGQGLTECGATSWLSIPGMSSRMQSARCPRCCIKTGMPPGEGSPKNIDECRPLAEKRIARLSSHSKKS